MLLYCFCFSMHSFFGHEDFPDGTVVKNLLANTGDTRNTGSILGWGRSPEGGQGNPLQYSSLGNPMDRGAWRTTVHGVAKSGARQSDQHMLGHEARGILAPWPGIEPTVLALGARLQHWTSREVLGQGFPLGASLQGCQWKATLCCPSCQRSSQSRKTAPLPLTPTMPSSGLSLLSVWIFCYCCGGISAAVFYILKH